MWNQSYMWVLFKLSISCDCLETINYFSNNQVIWSHLEMPGFPVQVLLPLIGKILVAHQLISVHLASLSPLNTLKTVLILEGTKLAITSIKEVNSTGFSAFVLEVFIYSQSFLFNCEGTCFQLLENIKVPGKILSKSWLCLILTPFLIYQQYFSQFTVHKHALQRKRLECFNHSISRTEEVITAGLLSPMCWHFCYQK